MYEVSRWSGWEICITTGCRFWRKCITGSLKAGESRGKPVGKPVRTVEIRGKLGEELESRGNPVEELGKMVEELANLGIFPF